MNNILKVSSVLVLFVFLVVAFIVFQDNSSVQAKGSTDGMAFIKGGQFTYENFEGERRKVGMFNYYLDKTEVTNSEFAKFVNKKSYKTLAEQMGNSYLMEGWRMVLKNGVNWKHPKGKNTSIDGKGDHPVVHITYIDARNYCKALGKRLPTKVEWQYAAGGPKHTKYSLGDKFDKMKYSSKYTGKKTESVKKYPANEYGLYGMTGSVWEWCADYRVDKTSEKKLKRSSKTKALYGGSWNTGKIKVTRRIYHHPTHSYDDAGFRCAMDE